jgi:hypothetical protein
LGIIYTDPSLLPLITLVTAGTALVLLVLCVVLLIKTIKLQKRVDNFFGSGDDKHNIEKKLMHCLATVSAVDAKYDSVLDAIAYIERNLEICIQKVGIVRYNPFDNMGGDLCFALALLNKKNEGVVVNGIYGRDSSYTYGKAVSELKSKYPLSEEEKEAIRLAMENGRLA